MQAVDELFAELAAHEVEATPVVNFTSSIFFGASVSLADNNTYKILEELDLLDGVWPVFELPQPELIGDNEDPLADAPYNPHIQTGVNRLHEEGILGEGVIIAVVDSGVDYLHPDLGGGFGPGFKIESGWDFIGDGLEPAEDNDPIDNWYGHGTHVIGTIGAEGNKFTGVAPKARIRAYKVSGRILSGIRTDILLQAYVKAFEDGPDIISASIGDTSAWQYGPWAIAAQRIAEAGVVVVHAAGNSGRSGAGLVSGASGGENVVSVASTDNDQFPGIYADAKLEDGSTVKLPYLTIDAKPWPTTYGPTKAGLALVSPIAPDTYDAKFGDGCEALPFREWSNVWRHRVVLVRRTNNCPEYRQAQSAIYRGSQFVLIINDENSPAFVPVSSPASAQIGLIPKKIGDELERRLVNGEKITVSFPDQDDLIAFDAGLTAPRVSIFTSWGLTHDGTLKPDIAAPGGNIYSTYPRAIQPYRIASGTSMATPYIAGVVALYLSAHGGRAALGAEAVKEISKRLSSSGIPLYWNDNTKTDPTTLAPSHQQGGGQIDAYTFVKSQIRVSPNKLNLNHTSNFLKHAEISVRNEGKDEVVFQLSHRPSATAYTYEAGSNSEVTLFPAQLIRDKVASVTFGVQNVTIAAGSSESFSVEFDAPTGLDEGRLPIFSGFISLAGSNGETFSIPYAGAAADGKNIAVLGPRGSSWVHASGSTLTEGQTLTLSNGDDPGISVQLRYGTKIWRIELVDADFPLTSLKYPGVPGTDGLVGVLYQSALVGRNSAGSTYGFILSDRFINGTLIPSGRFKYVSRILKPFWDSGETEGWDLSVSPTLNIKRTFD